MDVVKLAWEHALQLVEKLQNEFPAGLLGFLCVTGTSLLLLRQGHHYMQLHKTKARIRKRQAKAADNIDTIRQRLVSGQKVDLRIVEIPFAELQSKLKTGQLTCRDVLRAYTAKALDVHEKINCVTGFILNAEERARQLDTLRPEERGPLHGIPISLEEVVGVKGEDSTAGFSCFIDKLYDDYGNIVKVLMSHGAVPFVRTNIPQGQISFSCTNPIFGTTRHPFKAERTCGGSTGGEAALLASHGSILGVGTDVGGSMRVPPHFCGVFAFKPTTERLSVAGNMTLGSGIGMLTDVFGPLGRDVASLVSYMKTALEPEMFRLDPLLPPMPWREELHSSRKPLRIGFYIHDGGLMPVPAVHRAVLLAKRALEAKGHQVVEFKLPDVIGATRDFTAGALLCADGELLGGIMKHDVLDKSLTDNLLVEKIPWSIRWLMSKLFFFLHPVERRLMVVKSCGGVYNWWTRNDQREIFRRNFTKQMFSQKIDALLCPAFPIPAFQIGNEEHSAAGMTYTAVYNVLDFPVGVVPVTHVTSEDVKNMESYPKTYLTDKYVHKVCEGSEGLPIAVQCASFPFLEEVVLRIMKDLESGLRLRS